MASDVLPLFLARHGRTAWNQARLYQGRSDPPLSADGIADAEALAFALHGAGIGRIFASPLARAARTAEIVAARLKLAAPRLDARLQEIGFGDWEGLTQAQIKARWPEGLRQWKSAPAEARFPGGERLETARARLDSFLDDEALWRPPAAGPAGVLVVAHSVVIRLASLRATGRPLAALRQTQVGPAAVLRFTLQRAGGATLLNSIREGGATCASY